MSKVDCYWICFVAVAIVLYYQIYPFLLRDLRDAVTAHFQAYNAGDIVISLVTPRRDFSFSPMENIFVQDWYVQLPGQPRRLLAKVNYCYANVPIVEIYWHDTEGDPQPVRVYDKTNILQLNSAIRRQLNHIQAPLSATAA